jgi:hypothetical protein
MVEMMSILTVGIIFPIVIFLKKTGELIYRYKLYHLSFERFKEGCKNYNITGLIKLILLLQKKKIDFFSFAKSL